MFCRAADEMYSWMKSGVIDLLWSKAALDEVMVSRAIASSSVRVRATAESVLEKCDELMAT